MSNVSFGTNISVQKKRVKFYNRSSSAVTLYEGMPVCYLFDTTTNILGYSKSSSAAGSTTTEGYQNEGKFLLVELPYSDNLLWFAGVLTADFNNVSVAATSYEWVEIYEPNGAIVPVRADIACTVGKTILAIESDSQALTVPLSASEARPVAIAEETTDLSSTAGLTLARLCPQEFIYQDLNGTALNIPDEATAACVVNRINVTSAQSAGRFTAFEVKGAITSTAHSTGYGIAIYGEASISAAVSGETAGNSFWLNLTGGTQTNEIYATEIGLYESGANLASCNRISPLVVRSQLDSTNGPNSSHYMITFICDGTGDHPDALFAANESADLAMTTKTSAAVSHIIPIHVGPPGSTTTYYIMVSDAA